MRKKWVYKKVPSQERICQLAKILSLNELICTLLIQRGVTNLAQAKSFFRPSFHGLHDPFEMKGMSIAVDRLTEAIFNEEKILIYGDYDVDGTTSVALVSIFLKKYSSNVFAYIPDRYTEGYGVSHKGIDWAIDHGINLLITLDCGIRAVDTIKKASEASIDVVVCDHHLPGEKLPPALAILDPKQEECNYPYKELSGCGIGYKLLEGFSIQNGIDTKERWNLLDLVAVSIASDIVPITGENRILAWYGMQKINKCPLPGFAAMIAQAKMYIPITISDIVFGIGPKINAAGRIGHAKTALDLLTQPTKETAFVFAEKLNIENTERKKHDESITNEALQMIVDQGMEGNATTVLYNKDWHKGVIGIVASRCIEHHYKPTIIMTESNGKISGSARSVQRFDIHYALEKCSEYLLQFGGHRAAAGLVMEHKQLNAFQQAFEEEVSNTILPEQQVPFVNIDLEIELPTINTDFFHYLRQLEPFGPQNMRPIFCSKNVILKTSARILKEKHLKLQVYQKGMTTYFDAIGFNMSSFHDQLNQPFNIAFTIEENHYKGNTMLQLMLKDIRVWNDRVQT